MFHVKHCPPVPPSPPVPSAPCLWPSFRDASRIPASSPLLLRSPASSSRLSRGRRRSSDVWVFMGWCWGLTLYWTASETKPEGRGGARKRGARHGLAVDDGKGDGQRSLVGAAPGGPASRRHAAGEGGAAHRPAAHRRPARQGAQGQRRGGGNQRQDLGDQPAGRRLRGCGPHGHLQSHGRQHGARRGVCPAPGASGRMGRLRERRAVARAHAAPAAGRLRAAAQPLPRPAGSRRASPARWRPRRGRRSSTTRTTPCARPSRARCPTARCPSAWTRTWGSRRTP